MATKDLNAKELVQVERQMSNLWVHDLGVLDDLDVFLWNVGDLENELIGFRKLGSREDMLIENS